MRGSEREGAWFADRVHHVLLSMSKYAARPKAMQVATPPSSL